MSDITRKTIAELIDQLITNNIKCFMYQDQVTYETDPEKVANAGKMAQKTNAIRNQLIRAINEFFSDSENSPLTKTYDE